MQERSTNILTIPLRSTLSTNSVIVETNLDNEVRSILSSTDRYCLLYCHWQYVTSHNLCINWSALQLGSLQVAWERGSCKYELVDAIRVWWSIHKVRVRWAPLGKILHTFPYCPLIVACLMVIQPSPSVLYPPGLVLYKQYRTDCHAISVTHIYWRCLIW